jgi:hypothetical protein
MTMTAVPSRKERDGEVAVFGELVQVRGRVCLTSLLLLCVGVWEVLWRIRIAMALASRKKFRGLRLRPSLISPHSAAAIKSGYSSALVVPSQSGKHSFGESSLNPLSSFLLCSDPS